MRNHHCLRRWDSFSIRSYLLFLLFKVHLIYIRLNVGNKMGLQVTQFTALHLLFSIFNIVDYEQAGYGLFMACYILNVCNAKFANQMIAYPVY